jgi:phosphoglycolate phosphatase-like HAD superfamily hydrolase
MTTRPVIALDADGVLLDYSTAYAGAWERAFSWHPVERDPSAYWPMDRWGVDRLAGEPLERFRACFDAEFWSTIPAIAGAVEACHALHDAGFTLVCVSALEIHYEAARLNNLRRHGFPIERVVATGSIAGPVSPKAAALAELDPRAFVDDYLPYLRGLKPSIHTALVLRQSTGSPNVGADLAAVCSVHANLLAFSRWWLGSDGRDGATSTGLR